MNQTLVSNIISDIASDLHQEAPQGFIWQKNSDEYDAKNDIVWEGGWVLVPETVLKECHEPCSKKKLFEPKYCKWNCPNGHMEIHYCYKNDGGYNKWLAKHKKEKIEKERNIIALALNPSYHVCKHNSHDTCTNSVCCDFFWHDGNCKFTSDVDGQPEGYAVRSGNQ